jgi:predicted dehydrogenase
MIGGAFDGHGPEMEFTVTPTRADSMVTRRILPFRITDELYRLKKFDPNAVEVLATAMWQQRELPIAYTKSYGKGKVYYMALGHSEAALNHSEVRKLIRRGVDWTFGRAEGKPLKAAVIGYGASFKMGQHHLKSLKEGAGFEPVGICDLVEQRRIEGTQDFPGITTYASADKMLKVSGADLIVVITEHCYHAKIAVQCLNAGKHVVTEKPFCVTVKEADTMIDAARKNKKMLSVFHNRRWDGDYMAIKRVINQGMIGDVFHVEACMGGYGHPGYWWRADKKISGGAFYDWGAHVVDWVLGLAPGKIMEVSGYFQDKRVWFDVTNEDHCNATVRFSSGCSANIELSSLAAVKKPRWRILGTQGGILDWDTDDTFTVFSHKNGISLESKMKYFQSDWHAYYRNVADHLLLGEALAVTPESARRVISLISTAEQSSRTGKAMPVPKHCV